MRGSRRAPKATLWEELDREQYLKEELFEIFEGIVAVRELEIRFGEPVEDLTLSGGNFRVRSPRGTHDARNIVLAQGRRGLPRKLGVPGEDRAKVMYRLLDAAAYRDRDILVVGGGDAIARGQIQARFGSEVVEIENDYVFVFAGGVPRFDLLKETGARFGGGGETG